MDKTLDLDELERVAREATPGEWVSFDRDTASNIYSAGNDGSLLAVCHSYSTDVSEKRPNAARRRANAAYIAAFDPPTILALITAARRPALPDREVSDDVLHAMARAYEMSAFGGISLANKSAERRLKAMRAAFAVLSPAQAEREGWVLVPREPTEAMVAAGWEVANLIGPSTLGVITDTNCHDTYRAMLSAAPKVTI